MKKNQFSIILASSLVLPGCNGPETSVNNMDLFYQLMEKYSLDETNMYFPPESMEKINQLSQEELTFILSEFEPKISQLSKEKIVSAKLDSLFNLSDSLYNIGKVEEAAEVDKVILKRLKPAQRISQERI
ncbi:MAG: hypothetical protein AAF600_07310 [Bacteroidota bacterium]